MTSGLDWVGKSKSVTRAAVFILIAATGAITYPQSGTQSRSQTEQQIVEQEIRKLVLFRSQWLLLSTFYLQLAKFGGFFGRLPLLTRGNFGGVTTRPMILRSGWFVFAVMFLHAGIRKTLKPLLLLPPR